MIDYLKNVAELAVRAFAQALILFFASDQLNVVSVDWKQALGLGGGAALLSLLTSLSTAGLNSAANGNASILATQRVPSVKVTPPDAGLAANINP